jgi:predicted dehydrogenase
MADKITRRTFMEATALMGAGALLAPPKLKSPNDRLNIGVIGIANQGSYDLHNVASENIVALCDIDDNYLAAGLKEFTQATPYNDYRLLLKRKDLDAVVIATPDHTHAPATLLALQTGHHVYCEKPLTHTVVEARQVAEMAKRHNRVTQIGTQIHAGSNYRRVVELVQSGAIGKISEVHVWVGRDFGAGTSGRPADTPPVPANIHWDLWIGTAPYRPYHPAYIPFNWRAWWDFGGGSLGDMGCHHMDLPHWALKLRHPETVEAEGPPVQQENTPPWLIVRYRYPAREELPAVDLTWYHGGKRPHYFADGTLPGWGDGTLFVGEKGMLLAGYDAYKLLPEKSFEGFTPPPPTIPDSIGHHKEWIEACKTDGPTTCNFDYSGALTEAVLLGNVAFRVGHKIEWDAENLRVKNSKDADKFLRPHYRKEWKRTL